MELAWYIIAIAFTILVVWIAAAAAARRRKALAALAARLGLWFSPAEDRKLAERYGFLNDLAKGSNRYAFNVMTGTYRGYPVLIFDYHYETDSMHSHGYVGEEEEREVSFFILTLPRPFPELRIVREGVFSKIAQALGFDDIDFESHEFSRKFCVRSKDKKFAYDICNPRMLEYLLANDDLSVEIEETALAIGFSSQLAPERIEHNLHRLIEIRERIPDYLLEEGAPCRA
jgi:hypothetical protein